MRRKGTAKRKFLHTVTERIAEIMQINPQIFIFANIIAICEWWYVTACMRLEWGFAVLHLKHQKRIHILHIWSESSRECSANTVAALENWRSICRSNRCNIRALILSYTICVCLAAAAYLIFCDCDCVNLDLVLEYTTIYLPSSLNSAIVYAKVIELTCRWYCCWLDVFCIQKTHQVSTIKSVSAAACYFISFCITTALLLRGALKKTKLFYYYYHWRDVCRQREPAILCRSLCGLNAWIIIMVFTEKNSPQKKHTPAIMATTISIIESCNSSQ